jgi:hypothetical protein
MDRPTAPLPASDLAWVQRRDRPRGLMAAIWATGIAAALAALALIGASDGFIGPGHAAAAHRGTSRPGLVSMVSSDARQATYRVPEGPFGLTITTDRPTWVQVRSASGPAAFGGVLPAGSSRHFDATGSMAVQLGAGGASIDVESGARHQAVTPSVAPFILVFQPA